MAHLDWKGKGTSEARNSMSEKGRKEERKQEKKKKNERACICVDYHSIIRMPLHHKCRHQESSPASSRPEDVVDNTFGLNSATSSSASALAPYDHQLQYHLHYRPHCRVVMYLQQTCLNCNVPYRLQIGLQLMMRDEGDDSN